MSLTKTLEPFKVTKKGDKYNLVDLAGGKYEVDDYGWKKVIQAIVDDKDQKSHSLSQSIGSHVLFAFYLDIDHGISNNNLQAIISYFETNHKFKVFYDKSSGSNNYHMFFRDNVGKKIIVNKTKAKQIVDDLLRGSDYLKPHIDKNFSGLRLPNMPKYDHKTKTFLDSR